MTSEISADDLDFPARASRIIRIVDVYTDTENWDYQLGTYDIDGTTDWVTIDRAPSVASKADGYRLVTQLSITVKNNDDEDYRRTAYIDFLVNGEHFNPLPPIIQEPLKYTEEEQQIITAQNIIAQYDYMQLNVDWSHWEGYYYNGTPRTGVFNYTGGGLNLSIPITLGAIVVNDYDYDIAYAAVGISNIADADAEIHVTGSIYTGYNHDAAEQHYSGDFDISIYGYLNGEYINKTLTQDSTNQ